MHTKRPHHFAVGVWLLTLCAMVFVMVVIGALTRLTHSGLSIVEWKLVTGVFPPLTEQAWQEAFALYQQYPEYQKINVGMTLAEYKSIFWLEYLHRLWGRFIGIAFFVPFVIFLLQRRLSWSLAPRLFLIFVLGGLQGVLGWYMVASGLVDRPHVSQYRLAMHLFAAFFLYGAMLWIALDLLKPHRVKDERRQWLSRFGTALLALVSITIISGALVAGTRAGFAFNDFPTMGGKWLPDGLLALDPWVRNFGENIITVQFQHRILALLTGCSVIALFILVRQTVGVHRGIKRAAWALLALVASQVSLGIATLMMVVPIALATLHQATGLLLFSAVIWFKHELLR